MNYRSFLVATPLQSFESPERKSTKIISGCSVRWHMDSHAASFPPIVCLVFVYISERPVVFTLSLLSDKCFILSLSFWVWAFIFSVLFSRLFLPFSVQIRHSLSIFFCYRFLNFRVIFLIIYISSDLSIYFLIIVSIHPSLRQSDLCRVFCVHRIEAADKYFLKNTALAIHEVLSCNLHRWSTNPEESHLDSS